MLNLDPVVKVNINVNAGTALSGVYSVGLILGSTKSASEFVIPTTERVRTYYNAADVKTDFGANAPETLAAEKYFGVNPAPRTLLIGVIDNTVEEEEGDPAETPVQALAAVLQKTNAFYGIYVPSISDTEITAIATYLGTLEHHVLFVDQTGTPDQAVSESSILSLQFVTKSKRVMVTVCNPYGSAAVMGMAMSLARTHSDSNFAMCYKTIPGLNLLDITENLATQIKALNGNIYVARGFAYTLFETGTTSSGIRYHEVLYIDEIADAIRNACVGALVNSDTPIPMNDTANSIFSGIIGVALDDFVGRGILANGVYRGISSVLETGDTINGYAIVTRSYDEQTDADREAHKAMPITIFLNFAGAVESIELTVNVQRQRSDK